MAADDERARMRGRRRTLPVVRESPPASSRREVLKSAGAMGVVGAFTQLRLSTAEGHVSVATDGGKAYVRPPGALDEDDFIRRCIRCHKCGENCSAGCIRFVGPEGPPHARGTPYIVAREKACVLCMRCNNGCPSGALQPVDPDHPRLWEAIGMGVAEIDENICGSFNGYICGICVRACPLEGVALSAGMWEKPVLDPSRCVGCGLCEQACPHMPQAIRVRASPIRGLG